MRPQQPLPTLRRAAACGGVSVAPRPRLSPVQAVRSNSNSVAASRDGSKPAEQPRDAKEAPSSGPAPAPVQQAVQTVSDLASQLLASAMSWGPGSNDGGASAQAAASAAESLQRRTGADVDDARKLGLPRLPLARTPVYELKHMRKLCHLTSLTYKMATVTPRAMRRKHGLELVTTSWACEIRQYEHSKTAVEIMEDGDGMATPLPAAQGVYMELLGRTPSAVNAQSSPAAAASTSSQVSTGLLPLNVHLNRDAPLAPLPAASASGSGNTGDSNGQPQQPKRWQSPAEMVAGMVMEAAAAASAAAVTPLASAAGSLYAGLASLPIASALGAGPRSSAPAAAAAIMSAASAALAKDKDSGALNPNSLTAGLAAAAGPAAIAAAPARSMRLAPPVQSTTGSPACPSEWFVCDEEATGVRYFVIQGSDTLDHWRLNLTFDPVSFEEPCLGIKVHRGAYEAAQILYDRFLPMVYEHIDSSPFAKVCFTGHSIGGSLAILLTMMYVHRGVLPASSLANVYTFGAPAIFCMEEPTGCLPAPSPAGAASNAPAQDGHAHTHVHLRPHGHAHGQGHSMHLRRPNHTHQAPAAAKANGTGTALQVRDPVAGPCQCGTPSARTPLSVLGLPESLVRNVIMARDIVPRAFSCNYGLVTDILKSWGPSYRAHAGLAHPTHKHMYFFTGRMVVLQPDRWHWFASPEPGHELLPPGPDVYLMGEPNQTLLAGQGWPQPLDPPHDIGDHHRDVNSHAPSPSSKGAAPAPAPAIPETVGEALWQLMDNPHPLDMLADPGAYLERGSISRYHNPDNYTAALGRIIYLKRKSEGRIPRWVHHAYSRTVGMESREQAGGDSKPDAAWLRGGAGRGMAYAMTPEEYDLPPWDSSDGDQWTPYPAMVLPDERMDTADL